MKRCPECRRDYHDDSLKYCLDDGTTLLDGPGGNRSTGTPYGTEPATLIHNNVAASGSRTEVLAADQIDNTNAIAVLPFSNMSRDDDAEYLSDGLAEELLNVLSKISGLRVAGRMSSFSFKGKQATFAEVGRQLNVSSVLDGSVRMSGKRVRISVQLVNVADGYHLWSETYDRTMDDIFEIQDDIAQSVVSELRSRLVDQTVPPDLSNMVAVEVADAAEGRATDPEAHRLMLLGRHFAARNTCEDLASAVEYFKKSLEIEANNPQCLVELGLLDIVRASHGFVPYERGFTDALSVVEGALRLEPNLATGHAVLSRIKITYLLDFAAADESIRRALELAPEDPFVLRSASNVIRLFDSREALTLARKAATLDPLSIGALQTVAVSAYYAGEFRESEVAGRRSVEVAPDGIGAHAFLALALAAEDRIEDARIEAASEPGGFWRGWSMAIVESVASRPDATRAALEDLVSQFREGAAFQIAEVYALIGQTEQAFEYLNIAIGVDPGIAQILMSCHLRPLHSDARWEPLLRKIGIPEKYWSKV